MHTEQEEGISKRDFKRLCELIYEQAGICLGPEKQTMLEGRLRRRLKALGMRNYGEYCAHLFEGHGIDEELVSLIDVVTTNKTDFFREIRHFEYLERKALPDLMSRPDGQKEFLIWSAGCSSGEEPYTMAIVLSEYAGRHPGFRFRILATDISTTVLEKAELGVYSEDVIAPVEMALRKKYFLRSKQPGTDRVRVVPELRRMIEFRRLNFMEQDYGVRERMGAIFCRNVLIYFDRPTQEEILGKLIHHLVPGGYLFVGHSETLHDMNLPVIPLAPALYRKSDG